MRLRDRVAIVTGAGGAGIGGAVARRLAAEGAAVVVNDVDPARAEETLSRIRDTGGRAEILTGDVLREDVAERLVATAIERFGRLDILVNVVGGGTGGPFTTIATEQWETVLRFNTRGAFLCSRAAARVMEVQRYGKMVFIASLAYTGVAGQAPYSAAKGALVSLTRALNVELGPKGINVNCVAPGLIDTPATASMPPEIRRRVLAEIPLGRAGTPDDVAAAVLFLVSDEASYVGGEILHVAGGRTESTRVDLSGMTTLPERT